MENEPAMLEFYHENLNLEGFPIAMSDYHRVSQKKNYRNIKMSLKDF